MYYRCNNLLFLPILFFVIILTAISCNNTRNIVPNDADSEDISQPLQPNEEEIPGKLTFGEDSVPGFSLQIEMLTDSAEVYVNVSRFTDIDTDTKITVNILDFIVNQLESSGFITENKFKVSEIFPKMLDSEGSTEAAVECFFKTIEYDFEQQLPEIYSYKVPYNITFDIFPVYIDRNYITFFQSAYCYTGGAHGNTVMKLITYYLNDGTELTFDDIFLPSSISQIREEVAAHMAYSYPLYENITTVDQYIDSLNLWLGNEPEEAGEVSSPKITLANFPLPQAALNSSGVVFVYPMYELTPGSEGCPVVILPYHDVKDFLKINIGK